MAALCQMVLNPAYYVLHSSEGIAMIKAYEQFREVAIEKAQEDFPGNGFLTLFLQQECIKSKHPDKSAPKVKTPYCLGADERLAIRIAVHLICELSLDMTSRLPRPCINAHKPRATAKVPPGGDYIFDENWEEPGEIVNIGKILQKFRDDRQTQ